MGLIFEVGECERIEADTNGLVFIVKVAPKRERRLKCQTCIVVLCAERDIREGGASVREGSRS